MKKMTLRITNNGKTENIIINNGKTTVKPAKTGTKYQILDENDQLISNVKAEVVGDDLVVFIDGSEQPSLILKEYATHYPIENGQYLAESNASFATAESAAAAAELSTMATTSIATTLSTAQLVGIAVGAVSVAAIGVGVSQGMWGNDSDNTDSNAEPTTPTTTPVTPEPVQPTTPEPSNPVIPEPVQPTTPEPSNPVTPEPVQPTTPEPSNPVTPKPVQPTTPELVQPVITLDPIATDDIVDLLEAQASTMVISGSVENAKEGDKVVLIIGDATFEAVVQNGKFSAVVDTKTLVANQSIKAQVTTQDNAGNSATGETSRPYTLDKVTYLPKVTIDQITADNTINIKESGETVAIQGSVTDAPNGSVVTIAIGDQTLTGTVTDGRFSVDASGELLSKNRKLQATVVTPQKLTGTATHVYEVDIEAPKPVITLDPIATDDIIDLLEAQALTMTITGSVENAKEGDKVVLTIGDATFEAVVQNGKFSAVVDTKTLVVHQTIEAQVTTQDAVGNTATAEASKSYTLDKVKYVPQVTIDQITADNTINIKESGKTVSIQGSVTDAPNGSVVTIAIGDQTLTGTVTDGRFAVDASGELLSKNRELQVTVVTPQNLTGTATHAYAVDVEAPKPVITLDPIATDDIIDLLEAQALTMTITGSVENAKEGDKVVLTIGDATFEAVVQNGKFSAVVDTKTLVVHQTIEAQVTTQDAVGNTATAEASKSYTLDKVKYVPQVTIDQITADNTINIKESGKTVSIQGSVTDAPNGSVVTIAIGDQTLTGTVTDGRFALDASGELLSKNRELQVTVVTPQNLTGSATHTYDVDLEAPTLKINLNPISGDNHISTDEAKQEFTSVTGTVDGASEGDEVIVSCGCLTCSGVQWVDMVTTVKNGGFSVDFKTVDLLKANYNIVKASVTTKDAAENSVTAEDSETYTQPTPLHIDITKIDDFSFNLSDIDPLVRIKGAVEFEGDYAVGMNDKRLHQVDVTIGGKVYSAGFHNKQFFIDIRASELEVLNGQAVSISFPIASGVWKNQDLHNNVYRLTAKDDGTYSVAMSYGAITPQVKSVTFDSPYLVKETETGYKVNYQAESQVEVSGQVIADSDSDVKVGDKIVVKVGDQSYDTTVLAGNLFSVMVDKSVLAKANQVTATLTTVDSNGVSIEVSDVENIISTGTVSGTHVITQVQPPAVINNDHSTDGYNFPYFIQKLGSVTSAVNTDLGGKDTPLTYTYHFVTAEERAAGIESMRELPIKAGTYVDPDAYHANFKTDIRNAYKEIEKYINVKFVEVDTQAAADTNIYVASFDGGLSGSAAYAWPGYNLVWNGGIAYDRSGLNFPFYTALHEIGHTLGMGHSAPTFTGVFQKEETLEFTNMSYRFGVDNGRYFNLKTLRMFDLAYLHHQFGVNKEARTGNDVYSFKAYNSYAADGDIYIWDGAGVDTFDASKETQGVNVNLTPGSWIYVGETREQNLVVKGTKSYTIQEYFGLSADAQVTDNSWVKLGTTTYNEYTEGQAFIGYGTQIENLVGSEFNDTLTGNVANNNIYGGAGNDTIDGGAGNDYLDGGLGDDVLVGGLGDDTFVLDSAADAILEQEGEGNDTVYSLANISLEGAANVENVILIGTTATEATGNALDNRLVANDIGNILNGGAGNDGLEGGLGVDTLVGGDGSDIFVFSSTLNGKIDIIDFKSEDRIELSREVFTSLTAIENINDYIKYDATTGHLSYDSDANGAENAVHFATLESPLTALENSSFIIA